ncbi:hypothetical protein [[Mycoplasma] collis]|uniref:hypothetical protein n=1 Tax=[Mycoplasma] collis TaxID=2127 RepID=UPI00051BE83D|nr:hypothetical protein [[Mycoplasma] collis]
MKFKIKKSLLLFSMILAAGASFATFVACSKDNVTNPPVKGNPGNPGDGENPGQGGGDTATPNPGQGGGDTTNPTPGEGGSNTNPGTGQGGSNTNPGTEDGSGSGTDATEPNMFIDQEKANGELTLIKNKFAALVTTKDLLSNEDKVKLDELDHIISVLEDSSMGTLEDKIVKILDIKENQKSEKQTDINNIKTQIEELSKLDKSTLMTKIQELKDLRKKLTPIYETEEGKALLNSINTLKLIDNEEVEIKKIKIDAIRIILSIKKILNNKTSTKYNENDELFQTLVESFEKYANQIDYYALDDLTNFTKVLIKIFKKILSDKNILTIIEKSQEAVQGIDNLKGIDNLIELFTLLHLLETFAKLKVKVTSDNEIFEKVIVEIKSSLKKYTTDADVFAISEKDNTIDKKTVKTILFDKYNEIITATTNKKMVGENVEFDEVEYLLNILKTAEEGKLKEKITELANAEADETIKAAKLKDIDNITRQAELLNSIDKEELKKIIEKLDTAIKTYKSSPGK